MFGDALPAVLRVWFDRRHAAPQRVLETACNFAPRSRNPLSFGFGGIIRRASALEIEEGAVPVKKLLLLYLVLIGTFLVYLYTAYIREDEGPIGRDAGLRGEMDQKYVMVNFLTGIDYWKNGLKGFEDAAEALGVSVEYRGATQYDVNEEVTVLEQVIAPQTGGYRRLCDQSRGVERGHQQSGGSRHTGRDVRFGRAGQQGLLLSGYGQL